MSWFGKIIGAVLGALVFGPIGAIIGLFVGHFFDRGLNRPFQYINPEAQRKARGVFFKITFSVMGHIAKSDGAISQHEIRMARMIMDKLGLNDAQRQDAMHQFNEGKTVNFNLESALETLVEGCQHQKNLLRMFVEVQLQAAYADGNATPQEQQILQRICQKLGIGQLNFAFLNAIYGRMYGQGQQQYSNAYGAQNPQTSLNEAYAILELTPQASDSDVKKSYRRQMSQNHPDKLVAKGLPAEMVKIATEKTQRIQKAYEQIRQARGMR